MEVQCYSIAIFIQPGPGKHGYHRENNALFTGTFGVVFRNRSHHKCSRQGRNSGIESVLSLLLITNSIILPSFAKRVKNYFLALLFLLLFMERNSSPYCTIQGVKLLAHNQNTH